MNRRNVVSRRILTFLGGVIRQTGLSLVPTVEFEDDLDAEKIRVEFDGPDTELLLRNGAELLRSLEYLTAEMLHLPSNRRDQLCFDAGDFQASRKRRLECEAVIAANLVAASGRPHSFAAMDYRDQRMLLSALKKSGLKAGAEGIGARRHVVLYPPDTGSTTDNQTCGMCLAAGVLNSSVSG